MVQSLAYLCVFEATKAGEPHLHILARTGYIPQKWLSDQLRSLIGAPIVDIRRIVQAGAVAGYVAKYIGKDPRRFGNCKRYWASRSYDLQTPEEKSKRCHPKGYFARPYMTYSTALAFWSTQGHVVYELDADHAEYDDRDEKRMLLYYVAQIVRGRDGPLKGGKGASETWSSEQ